MSKRCGRPLSGARVGIRNGPHARADERGVFALTGIPTGTRMLEFRAVTHAPLVLPVDVVKGAAPLRIALVPMKSVLDTVKVWANLSVDRNQQELWHRAPGADRESPQHLAETKRDARRRDLRWRCRTGGILETKRLRQCGELDATTGCGQTLQPTVHHAYINGDERMAGHVSSNAGPGLTGMVATDRLPSCESSRAPW